ncbi:MAG: toxin-antitoxin system HicB family antitoxin [Bacteroidales bacterium]|nr:toxin-antitoxin system HicB family antitoxin [Bacteroidales bacterium]
MEPVRRIQTAFRLEESLLKRLKRKAARQKKSLNSYVEALLLADVRDDPEYPKVTLPLPHSPRVSRMLDILPEFTEEELREDEKLAYILRK